MDDMQKMKIKNLRRGGRSYGEIAKETGLSRDAVISYCRRNGLQKISGGKEPADDANRCRACGAAIMQVPGMKRRVFCSGECRLKWWKEHPERVRRKAVYRYTCPHCGAAFEAYGNAKRKYCSHACYIAGRFGGRTDG